ncbi:hypothetical protein L1S32_09725 [Methanogenium sp. S4BF]|uniref:hypothetical protein n=1 Tax=Methanogenium sp. S4BF TaxID=1789226 RepID=UPI002415B69E|nr:hypothetical protein [Methanogenium sp. S4BF]WFN34119.1 hypothetical protein L1S32_09725 [Methanogenium sp. S4BF]
MVAGGTDHEYAIWVTRDELGKKKEIHLEGKMITFRIPEQIDGHAVLRLKGLGYRNGSENGNLLVRINLMEENRGSEWSSFRGSRQRSSSGGGFGRFPWMNPSPAQDGRHETGAPFTPKKAVNDPMQQRRAGFLIAGSGLVLVSGGYLGILPVSAWAGAVIVAAGIILAFFA